MKRIYTIGETVYDIIFKNDQPVSAKAGGAMLNTAISLGRLELPVSFISEIGEDQVGLKIIDFLKENKVDTTFIDRFSDGKTALALAFLNQNENADYSFYKLYPKERLKINLPETDESDSILFGSFFSITPEVRTGLIDFIKKAAEKNSLIIYDPNFRRPHVKDLPALKDMIIENIGFSSIVRGSDEDFELIFGCSNADDAFQVVRKFGCNFLAYTQAQKSVEFRSDKFRFSLNVPAIEPLSTIGAGDSFNAGLIMNLFSKGISHSSLSSMTEYGLMHTLKTAIEFSSHVCQSFENYISSDFAQNFISRIPSRGNKENVSPKF
jgi:fructokinase